MPPGNAQGESPSHPRAPLLPKLRGHFAEFLNEGSLARLRLLALPTCVGLWYGHDDFDGVEGISCKHGVGCFANELPRRLPSPLIPYHYGTLSVNADIHHRAQPALLGPLEPPSPWLLNINRIPIRYAARPRVRVRLTLR